MRTNAFYKVGISERKDSLICIGKKNWMLCYGYFNNDIEQGYEWRKNYNHQPTEEEIKSDLVELIDAITDDKILNTFKWNNMPVYLSIENQMNFKAVYDLAVQTSDSILPVKFKLGENADGKIVYYTFDSLDVFTDFYTKAVNHIVTCVNEGWTEKDAIDYQKLLENE